jgi:hypothetical protein
MAAGTKDAPPLGSRGFQWPEFAERRGAGVMHGGTHRHLDGFQVETARFAAIIEDHTQQLATCMPTHSGSNQT